MSSELEFALTATPPEVDKRQAATGETAAGFVLTPARLRVWRMRSGFVAGELGVNVRGGFRRNSTSST